MDQSYHFPGPGSDVGVPCADVLAGRILMAILLEAGVAEDAAIYRRAGLPEVLEAWLPQQRCSPARAYPLTGSARAWPMPSHLEARRGSGSCAVATWAFAATANKKEHLQ